MSLSLQVAALEAQNAELQNRIAVLERQLALDEPEIRGLDLMMKHKLSRQQAEMLMSLIAARGKPVSRYGLEAALPARDHAADRDVRIVDVLLCNLRKKIGRDVIENIPGVGWRVSPDFWAAA